MKDSKENVSKYVARVPLSIKATEDLWTKIKWCAYANPSTKSDVESNTL